MKLDNIRLLVTEFDACLSFYQETLGFKRTWGEPGGDYASFDVGDGMVLALFRKELMAEAVGTKNLPVNMQVQDNFALIFEVTDLEKTVQDIERRGGKFVTSIEDKTHWGIRAVHLRDPDGHLIEFITTLPQHKWDKSLLARDQAYK
ncbi:VOC family protein [Gracilibacillus saliphilus]|uniref:VOC family protein n=1 Tax=Gracilibacillus saliphilus TaxID=543890 RepID=UPI0013D0ADF5|nr:VOC family protein [Gracilibacillus saliphilus]